MNTRFKFINTFKLTLITTVVLSTTACVFFGGENSSLESTNGETGPAEITVVSEHDRPGESPQFSGSAYIPANSMQTFDAEIQFPPEFSFSPNGFLSFGPAGSSVGNYAIDIDGDGSSEFILPIKSESVFFAWVDINNNLVKEFSEPEIFQSENIEGEKLLFITLPDGGDNNPNINQGDANFYMKITVNSGLLINPAVQKDHVITATVHSVDPDTGGANNGSGADPIESFFISDLIVDLIFEENFE